jgi:RasGEF domain
VPRNIFSHSLSLKDIDELEIARQLTLLEFNVFAAITPPEFLSKGWEDPNPKKSVHLKVFPLFYKHKRYVEIETNLI